MATFRESADENSPHMINEAYKLEESDIFKESVTYGVPCARLASRDFFFRF